MSNVTELATGQIKPSPPVAAHPTEAATCYLSAMRGGDAVLKLANGAEDQTVLSRLAAMLEAHDPDFAIVIPQPGLDHI